LCFLVMSQNRNIEEEKLKEEKCVERKRRRKRNEVSVLLCRKRTLDIREISSKYYSLTSKLSYS